MATVDTYPALICPNSGAETVRRPRRCLSLAVRKDLLFSSLSVVAGFSIMFLMVLNVLGPSIALSFVAFSLTLAGGIVWLMRVGEVA